MSHPSPASPPLAGGQSARTVSNSERMQIRKKIAMQYEHEMSRTRAEARVGSSPASTAPGLARGSPLQPLPLSARSRPSSSTSPAMGTQPESSPVAGGGGGSPAGASAAAAPMKLKLHIHNLPPSSSAQLPPSSPRRTSPPAATAESPSTSMPASSSPSRSPSPAALHDTDAEAEQPRARSSHGASAPTTLRVVPRLNLCSAANHPDSDVQTSSSARPHHSSDGQDRQVPPLRRGASVASYVAARPNPNGSGTSNPLGFGSSSPRTYTVPGSARTSSTLTPRESSLPSASSRSPSQHPHRRSIHAPGPGAEPRSGVSTFRAGSGSPSGLASPRGGLALGNPDGSPISQELSMHIYAMEEKLQTLQRQSDAERGRSSRIQLDCDRVRAENKKLERKIAELEQQDRIRRSSKSYVDQCDREFQALRDELMRSREENSRLRVAAGLLAQNVSALQAHVATLNTRLLEIEGAVNEEDADIQQLLQTSTHQEQVL